MVGSTMAIDLLKSHDVTLCDLNIERLNTLKKSHHKLDVIALDVRDKAKLKSMISPFDFVICAVPGFLGYETLKAIIEAGKDVVDISFFPENALELDEMAKTNNVTAIVDCGVAPGMDNIILGHYNELMTLTDFECLVGGLPQVKTWPFCYKAPFSPVDVIEEYTRPARYVENGHIVTREALSDCENIEFDGVGTLEAFNTDGLRSILFTMSHIPNMKEKTLRYPGHVEYIKVLRETGFFSEEPVKVNDLSLRPIDVTSTLLFNEWRLKPGEKELTVMRITLKGKNSKGQIEEIVYDLYDQYCEQTSTSSMSRTTGYTATAAANMILEGHFNDKGIFPPEYIGKHENCFRFILSYLESRNVIYKRKTRIISDK